MTSSIMYFAWELRESLGMKPPTHSTWLYMCACECDWSLVSHELTQCQCNCYWDWFMYMISTPKPHLIGHYLSGLYLELCPITFLPSMLFKSTPTLPSAEPYSGFVLWILQFYAMLVKRFYMSIRFWQATLPQHLIPILSVLVALVIVVTLPDGSGNDPKRTLSIQNSAIDPDNRILFWAELGEDPTEIFNFEVRFVCPQ